MNQVMKKLIYIGLFIMMISGVSAQTLSEKQKELEKLNSKISEQEKIIETAEKQKAESKKQLNDTQKKKKAAQKQINTLTKNEKKTKQELDATISKIKEKELTLQDTKELANKEFQTLFSLHYQSVINPELQKDSYLMAAVLENTVNNINRTSRTKEVLEKKKSSTNKQYEDIIWKRINSTKKRDKFKKSIGSISRDITQLDKKKKEAANLKNQFTEEAAELDDLIAKLRTEITTDDYSYTFSTNKLIWPVEGEVIREYGEQKSATYKTSVYNNGIDIAIPEGTPIVAVESGIVAFAEWFNGSGKLVIINHRNGFYSLYSHNGSLLVSKGDEVTKSQQVAFSGKSGTVDQPCLHFELRKRGSSINPRDYLEMR